MDLPIQSIDSLRTAGRDAAVNGQKEAANPYPCGSGHHREWKDGHVWAVIACIDNLGGE